MKIAARLEFYLSGRLFIYCFFWGQGRGGAKDRALNLPGAPCGISPDIPGYTKNPMSFDMGFSVQNKPAMTYSPTPSKVQYHRREES